MGGRVFTAGVCTPVHEQVAWLVDVLVDTGFAAHRDCLTAALGVRPLLVVQMVVLVYDLTVALVDDLVDLLVAMLVVCVCHLWMVLVVVLMFDLTVVLVVTSTCTG